MRLRPFITLLGLAQRFLKPTRSFPRDDCWREAFQFAVMDWHDTKVLKYPEQFPQIDTSLAGERVYSMRLYLRPGRLARPRLSHQFASYVGIIDFVRSA